MVHIAHPYIWHYELNACTPPHNTHTQMYTHTTHTHTNVHTYHTHTHTHTNVHTYHTHTHTHTQQTHTHTTHAPHTTSHHTHYTTHTTPHTLHQTHHTHTYHTHTTHTIRHTYHTPHIVQATVRRYQLVVTHILHYITAVLHRHSVCGRLLPLPPPQCYIGSVPSSPVHIQLPPSPSLPLLIRRQIDTIQSVCIETCCTSVYIECNFSSNDLILHHGSCGLYL